MVELLDYRSSRTSGASTEESPWKDRTFWDSYKNLSRGQLSGIMLGAVIGAGLGIATGGLSYIGLSMAGMTSLFGMGITGASALIAGGMMAATTKYYHDIFKLVGAVSGAVSAAMEINEERSQVVNIKLDTILNVLAKEQRIPASQIKKIEDEIEQVYHDGSQRFEDKFKKKAPVFFGVALTGAIAGLALVGAMLTGGYVVGLALGHAAALTPSIMAAGAIALGGGALGGATYGINRQYYRNVINYAAALFEGRPEVAGKLRARQMGLERPRELPEFTPAAGLQAETALSGGTPMAEGMPGTRIAYDAEQAPDKLVQDGQTQQKDAGEKSWVTTHQQQQQARDDMEPVRGA